MDTHSVSICKDLADLKLLTRTVQSSSCSLLCVKCEYNCFKQLFMDCTATAFNSCQRFYCPLPVFDRTAMSALPCSCSCFHSDVCVGQSQDDSIVGMKQSKQIPPPLPVSGNLSSSNPDLLQSHHRILDFNNQPGVFAEIFKIFNSIILVF